MSDIKITEVASPEKPKAESGMYAGRFYRSKDDGQLVFAASSVWKGGKVTISYHTPDDSTPVVAIGGDNNGYSLKGLFSGVDNYEEVDVEITVKRRG